MILSVLSVLKDVGFVLAMPIVFLFTGLLLAASILYWPGLISHAILGVKPSNKFLNWLVVGCGIFVYFTSISALAFMLGYIIYDQWLQALDSGAWRTIYSVALASVVYLYISFVSIFYVPVIYLRKRKSSDKFDRVELPVTYPNSLGDYIVNISFVIFLVLFLGSIYGSLMYFIIKSFLG